LPALTLPAPARALLQQTPSGVLHINDGDVAPAELEAQARRDAEVGVPFGSAPDWRLGDIAEAVGRGVK
jgi:hypothetical protein